MRTAQTLLVSTLLGATVFAVMVGDSASTGCGMEIEVHNLGSGAGTIDWGDSDVRSSEVVAGDRVPDEWERLGAGMTSFGRGELVTRAVELDGPCDVDRQLRIAVTRGSSAWYEYYPSAASWSRDGTAHVDVWAGTKRPLRNVAARISISVSGSGATPSSSSRRRVRSTAADVRAPSPR
jgi:hypothetical protein